MFKLIFEPLNWIENNINTSSITKYIIFNCSYYLNFNRCNNINRSNYIKSLGENKVSVVNFSESTNLIKNIEFLTLECE